MADLYSVSQKDLEFAPQNELQKKKLARDQKHFAEKQAAVAAKAKAQEELLVEMQGKLAKYEAEYAAQQEEESRLKAEAKANGGFYKPADPKVLLVVRIRGVNKLCPRVRKIFQLFRLLQLHNAAFVKVNKASLNMLKHIEPFCTFGYPDLETVRKLIYKRGYLRTGPMGARSRVRITDNMQVADLLGEYGVRGVEDIVHEILTCGPHFRQVNRALWTFKLHAPRGGFIAKRHGFNEFRKGDWGNREQYINQLVQKML
ncbi:putative 60S ribosomal protein L7 [Gregarina niphandrodes]|uniref:60S ribosomal protein L7 n=1 Tax=Gregarina niphandrodes TaxID=110365 RepID=A0A023B4G2_GRENI|nr:putative 60S ribosomal protein L7 [Gregarina niphandrodes]EZG56708.1 putative 60S ribosomal protein L7 [Gregarina niphandrodes]|eukprot:XP_011131176.1 putative 60S ribosomal protein L7 [Gregarina niphandrodes]